MILQKKIYLTALSIGLLSFKFLSADITLELVNEGAHKVTLTAVYDQYNQNITSAMGVKGKNEGCSMTDTSCHTGEKKISLPISNMSEAKTYVFTVDADIYSSTGTSTTYSFTPNYSSADNTATQVNLVFTNSGCNIQMNNSSSDCMWQDARIKVNGETIDAISIADNK